MQGSNLFSGHWSLAAGLGSQAFSECPIGPNGWQAIKLGSGETRKPLIQNFWSFQAFQLSATSRLAGASGKMIATLDQQQAVS
jgi:hypothetical protein